MAHYPTLTYSSFKVQANSLPAHLRMPPELDTTMPPAFNFELEQKVIKEYEASQAAAEKLAVQESTAKPVAFPASDPIAEGVGSISLADAEKKEKINKMKELTKADEKTCVFYLESYGYDLERASQEYFSK